MGVLGAAGPVGGRCQCVDDLLAPIRSKMKVLKKFKKRMGLGVYTHLSWWFCGFMFVNLLSYLCYICL